jgi:thiol-disulfide isomerase/thioredoxin
MLASAALLAADATAAPRLWPATTETPGTAAGIVWLTNHDKALVAARQESKPILVDFWATWCQPCRQMEAMLWSRQDVVALTSRFVCLRVDVDRDEVTAHRYRTEALPTIILADPWGTELARREGFGRPDEYIALLKAMPTDFRELAPWHERLAANSRDAEALRQAGLAYHRLKLFDTSTEFLQKALASKEVKASPDMRGESLTIIGWNHLKKGDLKQARKSFERCLEEVPTHRALDVTLYGLLAVDVVAGQRDKAQALLVRLESCCPDSPFTGRARKDLASPLALTH